MWFKTAWLVPINSDPIQNVWIKINANSILEIQTHAPQKNFTDLVNSILMPGLINVHTHLEWSYLKDKIIPQKSFIDWLKHIRSFPNPSEQIFNQHLTQAIQEIYQSGTSVICEISNTRKTFSHLKKAPFYTIIFEEILGWNQTELIKNTYDHPFSLHSLHGLPANIITKIINLNRDPYPLPIHFAESQEEINFLQNDSGAFKSFFKQHYPDKTISSPKMSIIDYAKKLNLHKTPSLFIHCVQLKPFQIEHIANWPINICICPRSYHFTGVGQPDVITMLKNNITLCLGTDGLSSNENLNLFQEIYDLSKMFPSIPDTTLLKMATLNGAKALSLDKDYGSIEPGKKNDLLIFYPKKEITNPEKYLVQNAFQEKPARLKDFL